MDKKKIERENLHSSDSVRPAKKKKRKGKANALKKFTQKSKSVSGDLVSMTYARARANNFIKCKLLSVINT